MVLLAPAGAAPPLLRVLPPVRTLALLSAADPPATALDEAAAAALVAGTAIGGGFLALPYTTAPAGFLPSSVALCGSWLFLFLQSLVLSDLVLDAPADPPPSFNTLAGASLGPVGQRAVSALFVALMLTTLAAQYAKGGALLGAALGLRAPGASALCAVGLSLFTLLAPSRAAASANAVLTVGFAASLCGVFALGLPLSVPERLLRADWGAAWRTVPTLLQLLVFLEVVPTVCELCRRERPRVRRALLVGSLGLLGVQLGWSGLGLGLVPFVAGDLADPLEALRSGGGAIGPVIGALGGCAVATTVIGTNLALHGFFADRKGGPRDRPEQEGKAGEGADAGKSLGAAARFAAAVSVPLAIACAGEASAFLAATDFAGAYPVALLWGVAPPLMALRSPARDGSERSGRLRRAALVLLAAASAAFVGANLAFDVPRLLGGGAARWELRS